MIKSFYRLEIDTSKGKISYEIDDRLRYLEDISLIEAPNDFGKSTLLHCIALGCFGDKDTIRKSIEDPGLLDKIDMLYKGSHTDVEFEITFNAHDTEFTARKRLGSPQISRILNGNPLTYEEFKNKFNIIYQIPSDPVNRLNGIIKDVTNGVNDISNSLAIHDTNLETILDNIENDPKVRLEELKIDIKKTTNSKEIEEENRDSISTEIDHIKKYISIIEYEKLNTRESNLIKQIDLLKQGQTTAKQTTKKINDIVENVTIFNNNINSLRDDYIEKINVMDLGISQLDNLIDDFRKLDIFKDFLDNNGKYFWEKFVVEIDNIVREQQELIISDEKVENTKYFKSLKSFLEDLPDTIDNESLTTPLRVLLDEVNKYLNTTSDADINSQFIDIFSIYNKIDSVHQEGIEVCNQYNNLPKDQRDGVGWSSSALEIHNKENQITAINEDRRKVEKDMKSLNIEELINAKSDRDQFKARFRTKYPSYYNLKIDVLIAKCRKKDQFLWEIKKKIKDHDLKIRVDKREKEGLEGRNSEEFLYDQETCEDLANVFQSLLSQLNTLQNSLRSSTETDKENDLDEKFKEQLQIFLAQKIPKIPIKDINDKTSYQEVSKVDHVKKLFITKDGQEFPFLTFGSGRTSSISYQSTINSLSSKKLSIVLLDEALMDDVSFEPLIKAMNNGYNQGKILAGICVRFDKEVKVESLIQ